MPVPQLGKRLIAASHFVRQGSCAADVGTDHGKLAVHLVVCGRCSSVFALDIGEKPLNKAKKLSRLFDVQDRVTCLISDGLEAVSAQTVDDIIIAGLGGKTICDIIEAAPAFINAQKNFVLVPATDDGEVRMYLARKGFEIVAEAAVQQNKKYYTVINAVYSGKMYKRGALYKYFGALDLAQQATIGYVQQLLFKLRKELAGKQKAGFDVSAEVAEIDMIEGALNGKHS